MSKLVIVDLPYSNNLRVAQLVSCGIPARALEAFARELRMSLVDVAKSLLIPRRTIERRVVAGALLRPDESERVVRLGRLFAKANDVFDDRDEAARWLIEPLDSYAGQTPVQLAATEPGAREVEQILGRIEHGVFSR